MLNAFLPSPGMGASGRLPAVLPVPAWIDAVFVALVAALGGLLLLGLRYGRAGLEMAARARGRRLLVAGAGLGAWLAVTGALAGRGFFLDFAARPPRIGLAAGAALLAAVIIGLASRTGRVIATIPGSWVVGMPSFRVVMEIILKTRYARNDPG